MRIKLVVSGLVALFLGLIIIRNDEVLHTNIKYVLTDYMVNTEHANLMIGSSSIARLNPALINHCGKWINRGIGNSQLKDVIRYVLYSPNKTLDNILIYAGENDVSYGLSIKQTVDRYKELLIGILKRHPDTLIHVLAIKSSPKRQSYWAAFRQVNLEIEAYVRSHTNIYFYHSSHLHNENTLHDYYQSDGIHLNTLGYLHFINGFSEQCKKR